MKDVIEAVASVHANIRRMALAGGDIGRPKGMGVGRRPAKGRSDIGKPPGGGASHGPGRKKGKRSSKRADPHADTRRKMADQIANLLEKVEGLRERKKTVEGPARTKLNDQINDLLKQADKLRQRKRLVNPNMGA